MDTLRLNDMVAEVYAMADVMEKESKKIIINTLNTEGMNDEIMQAICVVPDYTDICMFIHELQEDSESVDATYKFNLNAVYTILGYLRKILRSNVELVMNIDEQEPPANCIIIIRIEVIGNLIILDIVWHL